MQIDEIVERCQHLWAPPEKLKLSEWADKYFRLSPESSAEIGRWRCYPYQRDILDALIDPGIEIVTWMKSARTGYTKMLDIDTAFHIAQEPCSQLIVQPTVEDAAGYSKDEIAPMLRDVPVLEGLVFEAKSRDSNNTILKKTYPGGILHLVGANSARGFRRITVKRVKFDEIDGYPPTAGHEGDQIKLGSVRASTFWDRKIILGSTPTIAGISKIEKSFAESDQRYRFLPCPHCGEFQVLKFRQIKWPNGEPEKAQYQCEFCERLIPHSMKRSMDEKGEWRATKPFKGHAGFHIWAGYSYSPNSTWAHIAVEFLKVKNDREQLKTFTNTVLGETWEEDGDQPEWVSIQARAEPYRVMTVPRKATLLVASVDTQDNRLEVLVHAFGPGEEWWIIYHGVLWGDPDLPDVWGMLDDIYTRQWDHESGAKMMIVSMGIDSGGHKTQAVYRYCRQRQPSVFAIKGAIEKNKPIISEGKKQDIDYQGKKFKNSVLLFHVGVYEIKGTVYNRLRIQEPGPSYIHFPLGLSDEFYLQLTAEKNVKRYDKKGYEVRDWVKTRERNEILDLMVYGFAAAVKAGIRSADWDRRERDLLKQIKEPEQQQAKIQQKNTNPLHRRNINPWKK